MSGDLSHLPPRVAELVHQLALQPHPEGGWYREFFRSLDTVLHEDGRPPRAALTSIDFVLARGEFSAWHRVRSDEVWHLLEGDSLTLWLMPPEGTGGLERVVLSASTQRRHVVPADWWQAAEPGGELAYVGATVGPGFDFEDFSFGRENWTLCDTLRGSHPALVRLL